MKFDAVIGNPPYNNDLYIDFVQTGYQMLKDDGVMVMITPAKWQAKGGKKNEDFRANIVTHMKEIVYYPDAGDVFDIGLSGGVAYYSILKNVVFSDKIIRTFNSKGETNARFGKFIGTLDLSDKDVRIIDKVIGHQTYSSYLDRFKPSYSYDCSKSIVDLIKAGEVGHGEIYMKDFKQKVLIPSKIAKDSTKITETSIIISPWSAGYFKYVICYENEIADSGQITIWHGDNKDVNNVISYFSCKLIWWLVERVFKGGAIGSINFSYVPDPGAFDHPFKDRELYEKYGLTDDEIAIIESVIKERK